MENLKSPSTTSRIATVQEVRTHFAARLIKHYCFVGKRKDFLRPLLDSMLFDFYFGARVSSDATKERQVIQWCLDNWNPKSLEEFYPYPVLRLIGRHHHQEQAIIRQILGVSNG